MQDESEEIQELEAVITRRRQLVEMITAERNRMYPASPRIPVKVPRVKDRTGQGMRFESKLVSPYVRRAASVDAVLPWLYLRGISQADIGPALESLVGPDADNLSSGVVSRLKQIWAAEYAN